MRGVSFQERKIAMPKMNDDYFDMKKKHIINAAINVCSRKPLYQVTMKDIIDEADLSKGGIYLYYSSIDDILIEVINSCNPKADYRDKIDSIISESPSLNKTLENLFVFLGEYMQQAPSIVGKIQFEMTVLSASNPEKAKNIFSRINEQMSGQYFNEQVYSIINQGISSGSFHPTCSIKEIFTFLSASIDGIVLNQVLYRYYNISPKINKINDSVCLMKILAKSLLMTLNGNNSTR